MPLIKYLHIALAYVTVVGFIARGALALADSPLRSAAWIRISPHVIDTLLLICGIALAVQLSISPFAYIGFGVMAMRAKRTALRLVGFVAALIAVGYIFAVAYTKQVIPV